MELGILQKIDKDLKQSKRTIAENVNLDNDQEDIVSSLSNHFLIKKSEKFQNISMRFC